MGNGTVRSITATDIPTCRPDDTPTAVFDQLVGRTWESANTVYVLDGETLVGRIDVTDLI